MCDRRSSRRTRRAAAFCTRWSGAMVDIRYNYQCDSVGLQATSLQLPNGVMADLVSELPQPPEVIEAYASGTWLNA